MVIKCNTIKVIITIIINLIIIKIIIAIIIITKNILILINSCNVSNFTSLYIFFIGSYIIYNK